MVGQAGGFGLVKLEVRIADLQRHDWSEERRPATTYISIQCVPLGAEPLRSQVRISPYCTHYMGCSELHRAVVRKLCIPVNLGQGFILTKIFLQLLISSLNQFIFVSLS